MANEKAAGKTNAALVPQEIIEQKIFLIRGKKVMLDRDLAGLYEVPTKQLNRQVRRNIKRFPADFMFQLSRDEYNSLRCHFGTIKKGSHSKYLPFVFTDYGILMLSSVLNSDRAVEMNIAIMRVFIRLKEIISNHKELANRLGELEKRMERKDEEVQAIFQAIRDLMKPPPAKRKPKIGFHS
jgi:ORF6N domain